MSRVSVIQNNISVFAVIALAAYVAIDLLLFHLQVEKDGFWGLDTSLFLRYAHDPTFFHYTSPAIAQAIERSPSFTREIAVILDAIGFTYRSNTTTLYLSSVFLSTLFVYAGSFLILRGLNAGALPAAALTTTLLNAGFLIDYARLHPLNTVMKDGGLSMLAASLFLLSIGIHLYGRTAAALMAAIAAAFVHPVTGLLALGFVTGSAAIHDIKTHRRITPTTLLSAAALGFMIALYAFRLGLGDIPAYRSADSDLFFSYMKYRSSNPMPLRDGVQAVAAQLFVFWTAIYLTRNLDRKTAYQRIAITSIAAFWFAGLVVQIVAGEVLRSIPLVQLVLHRSSPVLFLMVGALIGHALYKSISEQRYTALIICVFAAAVTLINSDAIIDMPFRYREANVVFWIGLVVSVAEFERRDRVPGLYLGSFLCALAVILAMLHFGLGAKLSNLFRFMVDGSLVDLAIPVGLAGLAAFARSLNALLSSRPAFAPASALASMFALALFAKAAIYSSDAWSLERPTTQLYSRYSVIQMLEKETGKHDVIYVGNATDINGIRKPFFDFTLSWYNLYSLDQTKEIVGKLRVLGIDVTNDPATESLCDELHWLFRPRCERTLGRVDEKLANFDWRRQWQELKRLEPKLKYALIDASELREGDDIVARVMGFALVKGPNPSGD